MSGHGKPASATQGLQEKFLPLDLGHGRAVWHLSFSVVVVVISIALILLNSSG
jgi:hypothetical protein